MTVANIQALGLPSYYSVIMTGTKYPLAIDAALSVHNRLAGAFAAHSSQAGSPSAPDMTVTLDAGAYLANGTLVTQSAQTTGTFTAPTGATRRDIVYIHQSSGVAAVVAGAEGAIFDPTLPAGAIPIARVTLTVGMTVITDGDIDDIRPAWVAFASGSIPYDNSSSGLSATTVKGALDELAVESLDQVARDLAISALIAATSTGGLRGPAISWVVSADNFSTKTNATFDTDHYYNPGGFSQIAQGTGTVIGNMTASGGNAAAFDSDTTQSQAQGADTGNVATAGYVGKDWGSGNTKTVTKYIAYATSDSGFNRNGGGDVTIELRGSNTNDAAAATTLHTDTFADSNSAVKTYTSGITTTTPYRYHWVYMTKSGSGTNGQCIAEVEFFETSSAPEMTLSDDAETINADCELVDVYVLEKTVDASPTRRIRASIDGGATWATGTLQSPDYAVSDKRLYRYQCDVSAQNVGSPSPRSLKVEYNTLNDGKERNVYRLDAVPIY